MLYTTGATLEPGTVEQDPTPTLFPWGGGVSRDQQAATHGRLHHSNGSGADPPWLRPWVQTNTSACWGTRPHCTAQHHTTPHHTTPHHTDWVQDECGKTHDSPPYPQCPPPPCYTLGASTDVEVATTMGGRVVMDINQLCSSTCSLGAEARICRESCWLPKAPHNPNMLLEGTPLQMSHYKRNKYYMCSLGRPKNRNTLPPSPKPPSPTPLCK